MMTKEQREARLVELKESAIKNCEKYNLLQMDGDFAAMVDVEEEIKDAIGEYTNIQRTIAFEKCAESEDPMFKACEILMYPTIKIRDEPIEDSKMKTRTIIDAEKQIDLEKLHKHVKGGIGRDREWIYAVEKLNFLLTCRKAVELGIDPKEINDSYAMSKFSEAYDLGKNPASNTNLLKTLNAIIAMMIGEDFKGKSHDVNYLLSVYSKKNNKRALSVSCANHKIFRGYIQEICHRLITGKTYDVEYKKRK